MYTALVEMLECYSGFMFIQVVNCLESFLPPFVNSIILLLPLNITFSVSDRTNNVNRVLFRTGYWSMFIEAAHWFQFSIWFSAGGWLHARHVLDASGHPIAQSSGTEHHGGALNPRPDARSRGVSRLPGHGGAHPQTLQLGREGTRATAELRHWPACLGHGTAGS